MQRTFLLLIALAALPFSSAIGGDGDLRKGETVEETEAFYPGAEPLNPDGKPTIWCVRIIDEADGSPIPNARVAVPWHPGWQPEEDQHWQCGAVADWDGWVRIPYAAVEGWDDYSFADAPGYAAEEYCTPGEEYCELKRGFDVPVVVLDYLGEPVPHAELALNLGCGHIPDQRVATTDAMGRATLRNIDPARHEDIWLKAPDCHRGTAKLRRTWRPGDEPVVIDAPPGRTLSGRIVGADGEGLPFVAVGAAHRHRPVTWTDAEGRFELVGISEWDKVLVLPSPVSGLQERIFVAPPRGTACTWRLGAREERHNVTLTCVDPEEKGLRGIHLALVRTADGLTFVKRSNGSGEAVFQAPAGAYRLIADGELGEWATAQSTLGISEEGTTESRIQLSRSPTIEVDATDVAHLTVGLVTKHGFRKIDFEGRELGAVDIPIPKAERVRFRVSGYGDCGDLRVTYQDAPTAGGKMKLRWVAPTQLQARVLAPDGSPTPGRLSIERERDLEAADPLKKSELDEAAANLDVDVYSQGTVSWTLTPADFTLARVFGETRLSARGGLVDLGTIQTRRKHAPDLRVDLPTGLIEACRPRVPWVHWSRPGSHWSMQADLTPDGALSEDDTSDWPPLERGELITVLADASGALPMRQRLQGPPPWVLRYPRATLTIVATGAGDDTPLKNAVVLVDGALIGPAYGDEGKPLTIHGLTPGRHDIVVTDRECIGKLYVLQIKKDEARQLDVQLSWRNP